MSKVTILAKRANKEASINKLVKETGARTLSGGLAVAPGEYPFIVAEDGKAFGMLEVNSAASGDWVLPIVAGTMEVDGEEIEFTLSSEPTAKTLVIPNTQFIGMEANKAYKITIEAKNGSNRVTKVEPQD